MAIDYGYWPEPYWPVDTYPFWPAGYWGVMYTESDAALTDGEKNLLRSDGHKAEWFLSVHKPATLLAARLNNSAIEREDRSIAYDNGTGTGYATIEAGQPLWVGSSAGARDKGIVRIRAITGNQTSGTITVAENAIDWADDDYLTVLYDYPILPVWPYIADDGTFYKDGPEGDTYTDENEDAPPVAIIGPDRAGFMDGGSCEFEFDASDSYAIANGASISTYAWVFSGTGSFDDDTSATPTLTVTAANPDGDWVKCTVTDTNAKTQATRRLVFTHETTGSNVPYLDFEVGSLSGDWSRGGWDMRVKVLGDATQSDFPDDASVLLWHKAYYGTAEQFIGGSPYHRNVLFGGFIHKDSTETDWNTGAVSFSCGTAQEYMNQYMMFSISLQAVRSPSKWYEYIYNNLTPASALHHLFKWHSTLFDRVDVYLPVSNTNLMPACEDFVRAALFSQAENFAGQHSIFAHLCSDRRGRIYVEENVQYLSDADRAALMVMGDLTNEDWITISFGRQTKKRTSMVNLSGFSFDGSAATAIVSRAPGTVPEISGTGVQSLERQVLASQTQSNEICGRALAVANNEYPDIKFDFHGNWLGPLFLVPQRWWTLTLAAADTPRGVEKTNANLVVRSINASLDPDTGTIKVDASFEEEATGPDGITGEYPTDVPTSAGDPGAPSWPPVNYTGAIVGFNDPNGCYFRGTNADDWESRNGSLTGSDIQDDWGGADSRWKFAQGGNPNNAILLKIDGGKIFRSIDAGGNWSEVTPLDDPPNSWSDSPAPTIGGTSFIEIVSNPHIAGEHFAIAKWTTGGGSHRGWLVHTTDNFLTTTWYGLGSNNLISSQWGYVYNAITPEWSISGDGSPTRTLVNEDYVEGASDDNYGGAQINWTGRTSLLSTGRFMVVDMGGWFKLDTGTVDGGKNLKAKISLSGADTMTFTEADMLIYLGTPTNWSSPSPPAWWDGGVDGYPPGSGAEKSYAVNQTTWYRYIYVTLTSGSSNYTGTGYMRHLFDYIGVYPDSVYNSVAPISIALDHTGDYLHMITWEADQLVMRVYSLRATGGMTMAMHHYVIGTCTLVQYNSGTYDLGVWASRDDSDVCFLFGYMNWTFGGAHQVKKCTDAIGDYLSHSDFTAVENGWGTDFCGSFHSTDDDGGNRTYSAVRNETGANKSEFHQGTNTLAKISDLTFDDGIGVRPRAMAITDDGTIYIGADAASTIMVAKSTDDGQNWTDVTDSFPATGTVNALVAL